jgi:hypothetical protein
MNSDDIRIYFRPLPDTVQGVLCGSGPGYIILINAGLSPAGRRGGAIEHELNHIYNNDLYSAETVAEIEQRQHVADRRADR